MKHPLIRFGALFALLSGLFAQGSTLYVDLNSANPTPPYSDWSTAATNIQDAIDASADGDQIWVTNGVYQTGGKVMAGDLTNRVALDKAVTVQSVNGPFLTTIAGIGATNSSIAVRCAWLTNNAALVGFTLTRGATRYTGDRASLESGGGVWCASSNAFISDCLIVSNTAYFRAGGAYQGTLENCFISSNSVPMNFQGGAAYSAILNNCTIVSNLCAGLTSCLATNTISYYNLQGNYNGGTFSYSCTTPAAAGTGNFTTAPLFFADSIHLSIGSPGIGAGTTPVTGADIFGRPWATPPSVGCAETAGGTYVPLPQVQLTSNPVGFTLGNNPALGTEPFTYTWLKDGIPLQDDGHFALTQTPKLMATGVTFADAGNYQLVASNVSSVVTSSVTPLVIHCVDAVGVNPTSPFTSWVTAATNIQDAITAAAPNEIVLVTNGIYASGGKSMDNVITNRVSIDKAILVQSVNGSRTTVIQGAWDPSGINGPAAVRCVWMTDNSILKGFTIRGGATRSIGSINQSMNGGGVWGTSNAILDNCVISLNCAYNLGGGTYGAIVRYCTIMNNRSIGSGVPGTGSGGSGGGAANCRLSNCLITSNSAEQNGGGTSYCNSTNCALVGNQAPLAGGAAHQGTLMNCTVANNISGGYGGWGGAVANATVINSIVFGNLYAGDGGPTNYYICNFSYTDSDPLPAGTGNIDIDPQLIADNVHLAATSPCIGAGTSSGLSGTDIDNQSWNNPPPIGCDEWQPTPVIAIQPYFQAGTPSRRSLSFNAAAAGQSPFSFYWFKDGTPIQDDAHYANSTTSNLVVNNFQPEDAGLYQLMVSNSFGMVTSQVAQVIIHAVDVSGTNPSPPYSTWQTAATNIQDAINAARPGDIVLVTNGIYNTGGKVMSSDLTNRVALDKPLIVISVHGYASTVIEGKWDPATNGPSAVRCAWLATGATLNGFTLRNGATRGGNIIYTDLQYGGGAWLSPNAVVCNCVLTNNSADYGGGGVAFGTMNNCLLGFNSAIKGGGAYSSHLNNCTVRRNYCFTGSYGAGVESCVSRNCIISENYDSPYGGPTTGGQVLNYGSFDYLTNCCTSPLPFRGTNNISSDPMFLDFNGSGFALSPVSPCLGAGNPLFSAGYDLDDEPFLSPPSMGCDEFISTNLTGPLSFQFRYFATNGVVNHRLFFATQFEGRPSALGWSFGDGPTVTNLGTYTSHTWTNAGSYTVSLTAYNMDNPAGVSSSVVVTIDPFLSPTLQSAGIVSNAFQFSFGAQESVFYTVQFATNLTPPITWQNLRTFLRSTTNTIMTIQDPSVTNGVMFYRVIGQ